MFVTCLTLMNIYFLWSSQIYLVTPFVIDVLITTLVLSTDLISEVSCEHGSAKFILLCGFGGILSCGTTHTALVPLDLVKCRIQVRFIYLGEVHRRWTGKTSYVHLAPEYEY